MLARPSKTCLQGRRRACSVADEKKHHGTDDEYRYDSGALRKKKPHRVQESIDFLGARALLGNQAPVHIRLEEPVKELGSLRRQRSQTTSEGTSLMWNDDFCH